MPAFAVEGPLSQRRLTAAVPIIRCAHPFGAAFTGVPSLRSVRDEPRAVRKCP